MGNPSVPVLINGFKEFSLEIVHTKDGKAIGEWDFVVHFDRALILLNKTTNTVRSYTQRYY